MTKFSPPAINNNNSKYKVEDILVLHELNKRPTFVEDPLKTFSGHVHSLQTTRGDYSFYSDTQFIKFVSNLKEKELIRENYPKEILKHLTVVELKMVLKNISKPYSGVKQELIPPYVRLVVV